MTAPAILEEIVGPIATVKFNRPGDRNPLSSETLDSLDQLLTRLFANKKLRALVFTGTDNVFLSGADIRELSKLAPPTALSFSRKGQKLLQRVAEARQLTIAAINGYCIGGGLDFALACDVRLASPQAVFAHPGARLGIITGWGGTQRLPRLIGRTRTIELLATARRLGCVEAQKVGLITGIHDPVLAGAIGFARKVLAQGLENSFTS